MGKGKKIAGLVLGILALCSTAINVLPFAGLVSLIMAIVGLCLAVSGQKAGKDGLGTAAFVISLIALILSIVLFASCGICAICVLCSGEAAAGAAAGCAGAAADAGSAFVMLI